MSGITHGVADDDGAPENRPSKRPAPAWKLSEGLVSALPVITLLVLGFFGPMVLVLVYSFMPRGSFTIRKAPSIQNYVDIVEQNFYISFGWSLFLAAITVVILLVICYPLALALIRVSGRRANLLTLLIVAPLFVAENIRLQGWVLFFDKSGFLDGSLNALFGVGTGSLVNNVPSVIFGIVYIYLPFMLFPMVLGLSMVPNDQMDAARDLGASWWSVIREIQFPIAMPGFMIGGLLTFILAFGALSESNILGGQKIVVVADDIKKEFTYSQNWPVGSAISIIVIVITGFLVLYVLKRVDLDRLLGRRGG